MCVCKYVDIEQRKIEIQYTCISKCVTFGWFFVLFLRLVKQIFFLLYTKNNIKKNREMKYVYSL